MKLLVPLTIVSTLTLAGCGGSHSEASPSRTEKQMNEDASIGVATMKPDGTIVLQLRSMTPDGVRGEGYFEYPPDHSDYIEIKRHIGPLTPGGSATVRPWPDEK